MMFNQWLLYEMLPTSEDDAHEYAECRSARFRQNGSWNPSAWVTFRVVAMVATVWERSALTAGPITTYQEKTCQGFASGNRRHACWDMDCPVTRHRNKEDRLQVRQKSIYRESY